MSASICWLCCCGGSSVGGGAAVLARSDTRGLALVRLAIGAERA
jgi:hypothetical protein